MSVIVLATHAVQTTSLTTSSPVDFSDMLKLLVQVLGILVAGITIANIFFSRTWPWIRTKFDSHSIKRRVGAKSYTSESLEDALKYFVAPMCQDIDPSAGEEPVAIHGLKRKLFEFIDNTLNQPQRYRYSILLADTGMGKSTSLLNYYLRYIRRWRNSDYKMELVPLTLENADERINAITNKEETVLLLDALDEDTLAIIDHVERLRLLLKATADFRSVVISCRTQFFSKDEEIPKETGSFKVGVRPASEEAEYTFQKIYLSPFSDEQVKKYLKRKYPFWRRKKREMAFRLVKKIPHLTARPMLLAHIDDLIKAKRDFEYPFQLYEEMVEAWLNREKGFIKETDKLREFSERLAVNLYLNSGRRKSERIQKAELSAIAAEWQITIDDWKLTNRSLLNRYRDEYKFAHRSIMEYLYVKRFVDGDEETVQKDWTDQMYKFLWEMIAYEARNLEFDNDSRIWQTRTWSWYHKPTIWETERINRIVHSILRYGRKNSLPRFYRHSLFIDVANTILTDYDLRGDIDQGIELHQLKEVWDPMYPRSAEIIHAANIHVHLANPGLQSKTLNFPITEISRHKNPWAALNLIEVDATDLSRPRAPYKRSFVGLESKWLLNVQSEQEIPEQDMNKVLKLFSKLI